MKSIEKTKCCGCTACQHACPHNAIKMKEDEQGFKYPEIDALRCNHCGLCREICPFTILKKSVTPHYQVYAARHKSEEVLEHSSSGGMFTAFSDYVLSVC
mgnify:CR=1 FL=1